MAADEDVKPCSPDAIFKWLAGSGLGGRAADALGEFTRAKMRERGAMAPLLESYLAAKAEFDKLPPEEREARNRQIAAEIDAAEAKWLEDITAMAADPAQHLRLCETYCHEGVQVMSVNLDPPDGLDPWCEFGTCSHYERFDPRCFPPERRRDLYRDLFAIPVGQWPQPARDALARLAARIKREAEGGALGC